MLLACRQWNPRGLARRLQSLGAGAWRGAPLLPWRVQCPGCVCAALAAGPGGLGQCRVLCLPRFPLPAPHLLRCVWRAVPSGCPLCSLAGTPIHAVCAFRRLGPVALLVFPACPLCVCALVLSRRPPPSPPPRVGVARAPRTVPVLGAGRAVPRGPCPSACPASVPCSVWLAWGGGGRPGPVSPCIGLGLRAPRGVGAGVGTRHQPDRARSCELALRAVGAARGCPGGAPLAWVRGVRGRALSHPRPHVLSGVRPGPSTHWLWVRGVRAWGPVTNPTARTLACWLCALWGRHEGAWGGRLLPGCGESGVGRSPTLNLSSFGACGQGPLPTGCGCTGCGRGDPSPTPTRALLRAGSARCSGGTRMSGGGRPLPGRSGVGRSPSPDRRSYRACRRGAAPLAWVWGVRGGALSQPRPLLLSGVRPRTTTHWLWVRGVRAWGPVANPTARTLACWLRALWGRHEGAWGGSLLPGCGASGVGCFPTPNHSSLR